MSFPCIACGLCCRYSGYVSELKILINEENICRNFDEKTNKCRIYTSRPLICNIDEMYKQKYCHQMNKKEFSSSLPISPPITIVSPSLSRTIVSAERF